MVADLTGGNVAWNGPAAFSLYGQGVAPGIYAPSPWKPGSSLGHWDTGHIVGGAVMLSHITLGTARRTWAPVDIGGLVDIGYENILSATEGEGAGEGTSEGDDEGEGEGAVEGEGAAEGEGTVEGEGASEGASEGEGEAEVDAVYFVVANPSSSDDGSFVVPLKHASEIAHARAVIAHPSTTDKHIVVARIASGGASGAYLNADVNDSCRKWSWRVTQFLGFADVTAELYDGSAAYVEDNLSTWMSETGGQIGFWSYRVTEELNEDYKDTLCTTSKSCFGAKDGRMDYAWSDLFVTAMSVIILAAFARFQKGRVP